MSGHHRRNPDEPINPGYFDRFKAPVPHDERDEVAEEEQRADWADRERDLDNAGD